MINSLKISKLFGRFNYAIETKCDGVTIITGPNGFGKSTILKIFNAISRGDILFFARLDFLSIVAKFENGKSIHIEKLSENKLIFDGITLTIPPEDMNYVDVRRNKQWVHRVASNTFIDMRTNRTIDEDQMPFYYYMPNNEIDMDFLALNTSDSKLMNKLHTKILEIKEWSGEVRLISEQRLIKKEAKRNEEEQVIDVISELPKRLKAEISRVSEEYSRVANKLDSSYPRRLFATKDGLRDKEEYKYKLEEANTKFKKLNEYNLVDMSLIDESNYEENYSTALKIYFDDFSEKYKVFEQLIIKMDLFTKIINERLKFKKLRISRKNGFEVVDLNRSDRNLQLNQLSSGEKQEIVLFYDLIFDTKSDLLLLIDEPEISLHITWQKKFLDDLLEVSKNIALKVIVATHSPQIVSDHWDIQIDLGELYGN